VEAVCVDIVIVIAGWWAAAVGATSKSGEAEGICGINIDAEPVVGGRSE
jgi:hypothetical protein